MSNERHTLEPWISQEAKALILGSFPSPLSRQKALYYGNPQNRFWRVLAALWQEEVPITPSTCQAFLKKHAIALWDVVAECNIDGAKDASLVVQRLNPIASLCQDHPHIKGIFLTGRLAERLYKIHLADAIPLPFYYLPSPSAANASYRLDALIDAYRPLRTWLDAH